MTIKQVTKACKFCSGRINIETHSLNGNLYEVGSCYWCGFRYTSDEIKVLKPYKEDDNVRLKG